MKRHTLTNVLLGVILLAAMSSVASGQQCPDWSPKFDQIEDSIAVQQLQSQRSQGWPSLDPARNGGVSIQQGIQGLDQLIQQYEQALRQSQQAWMQVRSGNGPMPNVTSDQCRSMGNSGAAMAAACEATNDHNAILAAEGTEDLARCRAGLPPGSYSSLDSMGSGPSYSGGGLGGGSTAWDRGAASVADLNVSKRSGMVNAVTRNWQPPVEQQVAQSSLTQNTALSDPFAPDLQASGPISSGSNNASVSTPNDNPTGSRDSAATTAIAANTDQGSEPLAQSSGPNNQNGSSTDSTPAPPSPSLTAALDTTASNNSSAVSEPPVAQGANTPNGSQVADSSFPSASDSTNYQPAQSSREALASSTVVDSPQPSVIASSDTSQRDSTAAQIDSGTTSNSALAQNDQALTGTASEQPVASPGRKPASDSRPSDEQLSALDTGLSLVETSAQQIGTGVADLKSSGPATAVMNYLSTEVESSLSSAFTDIGGVVISLGKGLLDPDVALGTKAIYDQANDPNKLLNTNERNQMCSVFPEDCKPAPANK
jgi:hypothetical protein